MADWVLKFGLALLFVVFITAFGGRIEGKIWPAASPAVIERIERAGEFRVRIWGHSSRLRNCSFEGLEWRVGSASHNAGVAVEFEESSKARPEGGFSFGPWVLHLTETQLTDNSFAVVLHRCHPFGLQKQRGIHDRFLSFVNRA